MLRSDALDRLAGASVFVKADNLQVTGSSKLRGAYNRIAEMVEARGPRPIVACSSGNHGHAVAYAASLVGAPATVFLPRDVPAFKAERVLGYGAEVVHYDPTLDDRESLASSFAHERGAELVHPSDDAGVIAGNATATVELLEDVPDLDALVVPVGGGGLIAGAGLAARCVGATPALIGVEPWGADDTKRSLVEGRRVKIAPPRAIADGLRHQIPSPLAFAMNNEAIEEIVLVRDADIVRTMRLLCEEMKIVAEPSGATALAAILVGGMTRGGRVGVLVSGGNIDSERFARVVDRSRPEGEARA